MRSWGFLASRTREALGSFMYELTNWAQPCSVSATMAHLQAMHMHSGDSVENLRITSDPLLIVFKCLAFDRVNEIMCRV